MRTRRRQAAKDPRATGGSTHLRVRAVEKERHWRQAKAQEVISRPARKAPYFWSKCSNWGLGRYDRSSQGCCISCAHTIDFLERIPNRTDHALVLEGWSMKHTKKDGFVFLWIDSPTTTTWIINCHSAIPMESASHSKSYNSTLHTSKTCEREGHIVFAWVINLSKHHKSKHFTTS